MVDDRIAIGTDRNRRVDAVGTVIFERLLGTGTSDRVGVNVLLQIFVRVFAVADDRVVVDADRNGRVPADITIGFEGLTGVGGACRLSIFDPSLQPRSPRKAAYLTR